MSPRSDDEIDADILRAVAAGDVAAFESLFKRYFKRVTGFAARITGSTELAEEVAAESMMAVWKSSAKFQFRSRVSTWIFGIAYRQAMTALRRSGREVSDGVDPDQMAQEGELTPSVETVFLRDQLSRALGRVSPDQRAVMELTHVYGYSYPEIAEILDIPLGTVKTRMLHARSKLKRMLSAQTQS